MLKNPSKRIPRISLSLQTLGLFFILFGWLQSCTYQKRKHQSTMTNPQYWWSAVSTSEMKCEQNTQLHPVPSVFKITSNYLYAFTAWCAGIKAISSHYHTNWVSFPLVLRSINIFPHEPLPCMFPRHWVKRCSEFYEITNRCSYMQSILFHC